MTIFSLPEPALALKAVFVVLRMRPTHGRDAIYITQAMGKRWLSWFKT